jgi:hypothetical protein
MRQTGTEGAVGWHLETSIRQSRLSSGVGNGKSLAQACKEAEILSCITYDGEQHLWIFKNSRKFTISSSLVAAQARNCSLWTFAGQGQRVAAVERKYVGGACPNIACLPSKNVTHTAPVAHNVRRSDRRGLNRSRVT